MYTRQPDHLNRVTWIDLVRAEFIRLYGNRRGKQAADAVLPGIMKDFRKMLDRSLPGATCQEEYALEDGKTSVRMKGRREIRNGETLRLVTSLEIGGKSIPLRDILTGDPEIRI